MSIFSSKKFPWGFAGFLAMVIAFEASSAFWGNRFYTHNSDGLKMRVKNAVAHAPASRFDWIVLGDCFAVTGIRPNDVESKTGWQGFNLATLYCHTALPSYAMLRNFLNRRSEKPKVVVLSFLPHTLQTDAKNLADHESFLYDFAPGNFDILWKEFGLRSVKFLIPSLKYQNDLKNALKEPGSLKLLSSRELNSKIQQVRDERGYYAEGETMRYAGPNTEEWYNQPSLFKAGDYSERYLRRILNLTRDANVRTVFLLPTMPRDWAREAAVAKRMADYRAYLAALAGDYPQLEIWDLQNEMDDPQYYRTTIHLNAAGAKALSAKISQRLSAAKP